MTRDDMDKILYDGSPEDIMSLRCPECGGKISYSYFKDKEKDKGYLSVACDCTLDRHNGLHYTPNCVRFFGPKATIDKHLRLKKSA